MKNKQDLWDEITAEEMDKLLQGMDEDMFNGDELEIKAVKRKFEAGTGLKLEKKASIMKRPLKILTLAASFMLAFGILYNNVSVVRAAVDRILSFMPGHGIVETGGQEALGGKDIFLETKDPSLSAKVPVYVQGHLQFEYSIASSIPEEPVIKEDEFEMPEFQVYVNGQKVQGQVSASAVGSDSEMTYWVFANTKVVANDQVALGINGDETKITATMVEPDRIASEGLTSQTKDGITIFAQTVEEEGQQKIYLYANANFSHNDVDIYSRPLFKNEEANIYLTKTGDDSEIISYEPIESYGSMRKPPLILEEKVEVAVVHIQSVAVSIQEDHSIKVPIPEKGQEIHPEIPFELGMSQGLVKRVYWSQDGFENSLAIELDFHSDKGILVEGIRDLNSPGSMIDQNKVTLYAEPGPLAKTHKMEIEMVDYRIPVDMEIPVKFAE